ncbi:MAG: STAS domain-containing protein [Neptuniibacter sp.]
MSAKSLLTLPEELSIANAREWKKHLSDLLQKEPPLTINAADLSRVDTAAIQMLAAFVIQTKQSNQEFSWVEPSDMFTLTAQRLGMSQNLNLD